MNDDPTPPSFEAAVLAHLDAAWRLARWQLGNDAAAQDAVQEACVKALRSFETRTGPSAKAWFLAVVRNCCIDALRQRKRHGHEESFDEEFHAPELASPENPEQSAARASDARWIRGEIARLPEEFREVVLLREIEELSYKEISAIVKVPIGTVMSRLSRGRDLLAERLRAESHRRPA